MYNSNEFTLIMKQKLNLGNFIMIIIIAINILRLYNHLHNIETNKINCLRNIILNTIDSFGQNSEN